MKPLRRPTITGMGMTCICGWSNISMTIFCSCQIPWGTRQQPQRAEGPDTERKNKPGDLTQEFRTSGAFLRMLKCT